MTAELLNAPLRVALYARISNDSSGQRLGVEDQLSRGREYAQRKGYVIVAEEHDNSISAFRGKHRPGFERLNRLTAAKQIDAVVVYHFSRMTRNRSERAELIDDLGALGIDVHETGGMVYDLSTAQGRSNLDQSGVRDTWESEIKSERVKAAVDRRVKTGKHVSHPGYGWRSTGATSAQRGYELHPEQAEVVRDLAAAVAAGRPLRALARELNEAGIPAPGAFTITGEVPKRYRLNNDPTIPAPTAYGADTLPAPKWAAMTVKQLLARPSNVGLLHLRTSGETLPGSWPPILTEETHAAVLHRLSTTKGKGKAAPRAGRRVHLLTGGVAVCAECGGTYAVANRRIPKKDGTVRINTAYRCERGCTQRRADHLDEFARDAVVERLSHPDALAWLAGDEGEAAAAAAEVAALTAKQTEAAEAFVEGAITIDQLRAITENLSPRLEAAKARRDAASRHLDLPLLADLAGPEALTRWDRMDVAQRRLILDTVGMRIEVGKSKPTGLPLTELDQSTVTLTFGR